MRGPTMRIRIEPATRAWEPLTPRGVAAFATASTRRVWLAQLIVAVLAAATVVWFLHTDWFPIFGAAVQKLPAQGEIRNGKLAWRGDSPSLLAGDRSLSLVVDLNHDADLGHDADVCVELGQRELRVFSLLGFVTWRYPAGAVVSLNRLEAEAWWGAWRPVLLAGAGLGVVLVLAVSWLALATVYCVPAWLVAFFANRQLSLAGAWRLASAVLMPGALFMIGAIVLYNAGGLDVVRLCLCAGLHLVIGWIYIGVTPLFLPSETTARAAKSNPFSPSDSAGKAGHGGR